MTIVSDYTAILGYLDLDTARWNAMADMGTPVFVSYSFESSATLPGIIDMPYSVTGTRVMTEAHRDSFREALKQYEEASGIVFVEAAPGEGMINLHTVVGSNYGGWAYYPITSQTQNRDSSLVIDVTYGINPGGYGREILLHELGHALGLSHPHEGGLTLTEAMDTTTQTVMSYNYTNTPRMELSPLDRQALDHIYGQSVDVSDWIYQFKADGKFLVESGAADDVIIGVTAQNVLRGNGGNDMIIGRDQDDLIGGGDGHDILMGGAGSDTLYGSLGNDKLYAVSDKAQDEPGGDGNRLIGGEGNDLLIGSHGEDELIGGAGRDSFRGGAGKDMLDGGKGKDQMIAGAGNDILLGAAGKDSLFGGTGRDTFVIQTVKKGGRDTIEDFEGFFDMLEFRGAEVSLEDISLKRREDGSSTLLVAEADGKTFKAFFSGTEREALTDYFNLDHVF